MPICLEIAEFWKSLQNYESRQFAFWTSVGLLIIVSILKYFLSKECNRAEWGYLLIEMPIDLCLVILTILVTTYLAQNLGGGILLIIMTIIVIVLCCITRRLSLNYAKATDKFSYSLFYGFLTIAMSLIISSFVYYIIA
jgi:hypothetical protein